MLTLKNDSEFKFIYNHGKKHYSKYFIIFIIKSSDLKIGYVVSKKIGIAVQRNRVKRLIRESYRSIEKDINKNVNIIFIAKRELRNLSKQIKKQDIEKDMLKFLRKVRVIN